MYGYAMPRQYTMPKDAPYVVIPVFQCKEEHNIVKAKLKVPPTYKIPVFIGIGCADPNETVLEQNAADLDKQLHDGRWK